MSVHAEEVNKILREGEGTFFFASPRHFDLLNWNWRLLVMVCKDSLQGLYPFSEANFQDFSRTFPGLFQDSDWFFQDSKIHINPFTPKISILILLAVCHTFHIFYLSLTDFQHFPVVPFQDFPVLENATVKFQDFPGFPGPVRTLWA